MTIPADIDAKLVDPAFFAGTEFHAVLKALREEDPVHWTDAPGYSRGFWSLTRYEDCLRLLQEPENFSSAAGTHIPPNGRELTEEERYKMGFDVNLVTSDPPEHQERRAPFNPHFSVPAVNKFHEDCDAIIDGILDDIAEKGTAEGVTEISALLPVRLFLNLMAVPEEDWEMVRNITLRMLHPDDPHWGDPHASDHNALIADAMGDLNEYMASHVLSRRGKEGSDFATLIANKDYRGTLLPERDAGVMGFTVVAGGLETTRNAAAIAIMELARRPEQAALLQDPKIAKSAVEEIIRWVTPSKNRLRVATKDLEIGGKQIKKGDWVVGWIVSANRDESVFGPTATEFDITRSPNPHLGFGDGEHICLGRNVARLELRMLIQKLFERFPDLHLSSAPEWVHSTNTSGLTSLPLAFEPRVAVGV
ncbi:cytochrome P450 [Leucobacter allii]|uniref:Cytochrome P450 n=1 Tax=Leucobacter allii TaxID=2932247 RepID=A0ABY4FMN1_9MICO|nr:cytochrome P450 [Leucobacter allii]UOQ57529.1 cytochrome P450 [Leucobacter allii]